jgi:S-formylglutathione hydrolase FrmB
MKSLALCVLVACGTAAPTPAPVPVVPAATPPAGSSGATGKVVERTFHSTALDVDKTYVVYLPADYDAKPTTKWPVFYYLHGIGGNERSWVSGGHLDQAADQLHAQAIIVMPDGDDGFYTDSAKVVDYDNCIKNGVGLFLQRDPQSACVKHFAYETYIVKDLIADVDAHYHTNASREGRGIAGMSMGGFGAWELGLRHPDLFAAAASHSGYLAMRYGAPHPYEAGKVGLFPVQVYNGANPMIGYVVSVFGTDQANWDAHDPAQLILKMTPGRPALYLDCGTEDDFKFQDPTHWIHDILTEHKIDHEYFEGPGGHNFGFWGPRELVSLKWLQEHVAKP